jgi:hypothetical protein
MRVPYNEIYKNQTSKLVPAMNKKAIIARINSSAHTVDIYYPNNPQTIIKNIQVASGVDMSKLLVGGQCKIDLFDEANPKDIIVSYAYNNSKSSTSLGSTATITYVKTINFGGGGSYTTGTLVFTGGLLTSST